jgi:hypothetical protein
LNAAGFINVNASSIQKTDAVENREMLLAIGKQAGGDLQPLHFGSFI